MIPKSVLREAAEQTAHDMGVTDDALADAWAESFIDEYYSD